MSSGELSILMLVIGAFSVLAGIVGYQSFAESRWLKKKSRA
jgi:hypothetical protein